MKCFQLIILIIIPVLTNSYITLPCFYSLKWENFNLNFDFSSLHNDTLDGNIFFCEKLDFSASCNLNCSIPSWFEENKFNLTKSVYENNLLSLYFEDSSSKHLLNLSLSCSSEKNVQNIKSDDSPFEKSILWKTESGCIISRDPVFSPFLLENPQKNIKYNLRSWFGDQPQIINLSETEQVKMTDFENIYYKRKSEQFQLLVKKNVDINLAKIVLSFSKEYSFHHLPVSCPNKIEINFRCKEENNKTSIGTSTRPCTKHVETDAVCAPVLKNCLYTRGDIRVDLTSLHKKEGNWKIPHEDGDLTINMCGPLNLPLDKIYGSASVLWQNSMKRHFFKAEILFDHFRPQINLKEISSDNSVGTSLNLHLICNDFEGIGKPEFVKEKKTIVWKTNAACPIQYVAGKDCTFDGSPGFNLKYFLNHSNYKIYSKDTEFVLNLCKPGICRGNNNTALCWSKNGKSIILGYSHMVPIAINGIVKFNFAGERCRPHGPYSKVSVTLTCDHLAVNKALNVLQLLQFEETNCEFSFSLRTNLVCQEALSNKTCSWSNNDKLIDLSPLKKFYGNFMVESETNIYFLNICRSLNPDAYMFCSPPVSICSFIKKNSNLISMSDRSEIISDSNPSPILAVNGTFFEVELKNLDEPAAKILFECNEKIDSHLSVSDNNNYLTFLWKSKFACPQSKDSLIALQGNFCKFNRLFINDSFDLTWFENLQHIYGTKNIFFGSSNFSISLCGPENKCGSSLSSDCGVCINGTKCAGIRNNYLYERAGNIFLLFENGELTFGLTMAYVSAIMFVCGLNERIEVDSILDFTILINYYTPALCSKEILLSMPTTIQSKVDVEINDTSRTTQNYNTFSTPSELRESKNVVNIDTYNQMSPSKVEVEISDALGTTPKNLMDVNVYKIVHSSSATSTVTPKSVEAVASKSVHGLNIDSDCMFKKKDWISLIVSNSTNEIGVLNFYTRDFEKRCGDVQFCSSKKAAFYFSSCSQKPNPSKSILVNYKSERRCFQDHKYEIEILYDCLHGELKRNGSHLESAIINTDKTGCTFNLSWHLPEMCNRFQELSMESDVSKDNPWKVPVFWGLLVFLVLIISITFLCKRLKSRGEAYRREMAVSFNSNVDFLMDSSESSLSQRYDTLEFIKRKNS